MNDERRSVVTVMKIGFLAAIMVAVAVVIWSALPFRIQAHCDTLDGPVVSDAKKALEKGDVTPVLKWVKADDETEIRAAFKNTLAVRAKSPEAGELADMYFFETLVRIHRAGEGAPYTGLKSGPPEPIVAAADEAIKTGSADALAKHVGEIVTTGIKERFARVMETKPHADESVEAGREYVEAYVSYVHYVERLAMDAEAKGGHHAEAGEASHEE